MVEIYPHTLTATIAGESSQDENGDIITLPDTTIAVKCRYVPNGSKVVSNIEGQSVVFRGTCYVKKGDEVGLSNGDLISVPGFVDQRVPILQIHRAQLRTRIILQ